MSILPIPHVMCQRLVLRQNEIVNFRLISNHLTPSKHEAAEPALDLRRCNGRMQMSGA
jgi:hypothetical protein